MKEKAYGPKEAHEGGKGFAPLAHGAKGGALAPSLAAPSPPWEFSPTWGRGGGSPPPWPI